jgi:DNA-binding HxlR family transcriptional regulator
MIAALSIVGDKWTALIIKELVSSPKCYSEIEHALNGISPRTLSARLDKLIDKKVIDKVLYCEHPPRHKYVLTDKGSELEKILKAMIAWGDKYAD